MPIMFPPKSPGQKDAYWLVASTCQTLVTIELAIAVFGLLFVFSEGIGALSITAVGIMAAVVTSIPWMLSNIGADLKRSHWNQFEIMKSQYGGLGASVANPTSKFSKE